MLSGHRSAWRRRGEQSRGASCGPPRHPDGVGPDPRHDSLGLGRTCFEYPTVGRRPRPARSAGASGAARRRRATPTATAARSGGGGAAGAQIANGQTAFRQLGNLATVPVDGAGNAIT